MNSTLYNLTVGAAVITLVIGLTLAMAEKSGAKQPVITARKPQSNVSAEWITNNILEQRVSRYTYCYTKVNLVTSKTEGFSCVAIY